MNWYAPCAYNDAQKQSFHLHGRRRLKELADALGFQPSSYNLRSNRGGVAVMWNVKNTVVHPPGKGSHHAQQRRMDMVVRSDYI